MQPVTNTFDQLVLSVRQPILTNVPDSICILIATYLPNDTAHNWYRTSKKFEKLNSYLSLVKINETLNRIVHSLFHRMDGLHSSLRVGRAAKELPVPQDSPKSKIEKNRKAIVVYFALPRIDRARLDRENVKFGLGQDPLLLTTLKTVASKDFHRSEACGVRR